VEALPDETLLFLLGSRYCETDRLSDIAWQLFDKSPTGWARVQTICDYVHRHIQFGYEHARSTKSAFEVFHERVGVCRDYAHLAIAFCRCMNIPARYCTGYLADIGMPPPYGPMDFAGWFEAYLDGHWYTFDARNNTPRIGRVTGMTQSSLDWYRYHRQIPINGGRSVTPSLPSGHKAKAINRIAPADKDPLYSNEPLAYGRTGQSGINSTKSIKIGSCQRPYR
jgi:transglutaminase-like putative cysteine protease